MALQREEKHSKVLDKKIKELWDGSFVCKQSSDNLKCARTEQEKKRRQGVKRGHQKVALVR